MLKHTIWKSASMSLVSLLFVASVYAGKAVEIPLEEGRWETKNDVTFVEYKGRESIHLNGGFRKTPSALLSEFDFAEGTIEFDIAINVPKSVFPGIEFHITEDDKQFERIYFRPGNSQQINSFQYHPVYQGEHPWQLYGQNQRDLEIPHDEWIPVKVEVKSSQMAFYVQGNELPLFWTDRLLSGSANGAIRFAGAGDYYISNLKVTKRKSTSRDKFLPAAKSLPAAYLNHWNVSPLLALENDENSVGRERFSELSGDWKSIWAEGQGLVSITRHIPKSAAHSAVLATTTIDSKKVQTKKLFLGYSDRIDLYLNGELVFSGDNTFRSDSSKMRSRVHIDNDQLELELVEGTNVLEAIVYERFGGWALMAKLNNANGVERM